jgi:transcriptional regulator with XRE-family HTH domain
MLNSDCFIKNLETILDYYQLSAAAFADKIGVQRSSLSHLLSGRNKPSLDFILKIIDVFPEVDFYWFIKNEGSFPKSSTPILELPKNESKEPRNLFDTIVQSNEWVQSDAKILSEKTPQEIEEEKNARTEHLNPNSETSSILESESLKREIDYVMVFYKNNTFKIYHRES